MEPRAQRKRRVNSERLNTSQFSHRHLMTTPLSPHCEWGQGDLARGGGGERGEGQERSGEFSISSLASLPELFSMVYFTFSCGEWTLIAVKGSGTV